MNLTKNIYKECIFFLQFFTKFYSNILFFLQQHFAWDDTEEQSYRLWMQKQMQTDKTEVNWTEYDNEIEYRDRLRCQTEANSSEKIAWEDVQERLFRQKYIQER